MSKDISIRKKSDEEILARLRKKILEVEVDGHSITPEDIKNDPFLKQYDLRRRFGSFKKAVDRALLPPKLSTLRIGIISEKDALLAKLHEVVVEYGRMLSKIEVDYHPALPDSIVYEKNFGDWNSTLRGFYQRYPKEKYEITREGLIESLRLKASEAPYKKLTPRDVKEDRRMPYYNLFCNVFGNFTSALKAADLPFNENNYAIEQLWAPEDCILALQNKAKELGRSPKATEMTRPCAAVCYRRLFCSTWDEVLQAAGLEPRRRRKTPRSPH